MNRPLFPTTLSILSYDIGKYVGLRIYQHPHVQLIKIEVISIAIWTLNYEVMMMHWGIETCWSFLDKNNY